MGRDITIITPEHVELKFELAGIGSRFLAMLVDTMLQLLAGIVVFLIFLALMPGIGFAVFDSIIRPERISGWLIAAFLLVQFVIWSGYFLLFEATRNGQTPGKKSAGIRVIRDTGHPVDFRSILLRTFMRIVDSFPVFYGVGIVSVFVSSEYRRLGDYVAGTLVVKTGRPAEKTNAAQESASPSTDNESSEETLVPQSSLAFLHLVTREDYRALRHFLDRRRELDESVIVPMANRLTDSLAKKLQMDPDDIPDPIIFLENLGRVWERRMIH